MKILLVSWIDSSGNPGWQNEEDCHGSLAECQTVGFLVEETKDYICLALNRSETKGICPFGDLITIPKVAIKNKKELK